MIEPSDSERAEWPQATAEYVAELETQLADREDMRKGAVQDIVTPFGKILIKCVPTGLEIQGISARDYSITSSLMDNKDWKVFYQIEL